ncbi:hypothetical protein AAZX31_07G254000 [Glycine max]
MQMVHCIKSGVCRTVSLPHNCLSPPCTLTLTDWRHYQYKMECEDGRIHSALLLPTFCSSTVCYFCWRRVQVIIIIVMYLPFTKHSSPWPFCPYSDLVPLLAWKPDFEISY